MRKEWIFLLFAVLSICYGILVLLANSGTKFFLIWFLLGGFFLVLSMLFLTGSWERLPDIFRKVFCVLVLFGLTFFLAVEGCVLSGFSQRGEPELDYLIVLGAQVRKSGPTRSLKYRLDAAYDYMIANEHTRCVVSGGQGCNEPDSEARIMCDYLVSKGISADRILLEDKSVNTMENIRNSSAFLNKEVDHVGIVTNNFHVFRAMHLSRRQGYQHICAISAPSTRLYLLNNMTREFFGILKDFAVGNLA